MKTLISYSVLVCLCIMSLYAQPAERNLSATESVAVGKINKLFDQYYYSMEIAKALKAKKKLDKYMRELPSPITACGKKTYYQEIENSLNLEYKDLALKNIFKYITLYPDDEKNGGLLNVQGYIFAEEGDWQQLEKTIREFSEYAKRNNQDWSEEIAALKNEYIKILHNEPFNKEVEGIWVSDSVSSSTNIPYYIFRITNDGKVYLLKQSAFYDNELKRLQVNSGLQDLSLPNEMEFGNSVNCTIDNDCSQVSATFSSHHLNRGSEELAAMGRDATRKTQAAIEGAAARKGTTKAKLTGGAISLAAGIVGGILSNQAAISSYYVYTMDVQMNKLHKNCMEASVALIESEGRSNNPDYIEEKKNYSKTMLHKISSGDNILFATKKGEPVNLFPENYYDLTEMEQFCRIRKGTKLSRPQYIIPFILYFPFSPVIVNPIRKAKRRKNAKKYNKEVCAKILNMASMRRESLYYYGK